jgi:DNA-binding protein YbaB
MDAHEYELILSSLMQNINKDRTVSAKAGGDWVVAHANLKTQLTKVVLSEEARAQNPVVLSELIVSAVNQVMHEARRALQDEMIECGRKVGFPSYLLPFVEKITGK